MEGDLIAAFDGVALVTFTYTDIFLVLHLYSKPHSNRQVGEFRGSTLDGFNNTRRTKTMNIQYTCRFNTIKSLLDLLT